MDTAQRLIAAAAAVLLAVAAPAAATAQEPAPPEDPPAEAPWPPASTHGAFAPVPEERRTPEETLPLCGSEVTFTPEYVETPEYRALVTEDGDTVVETRGTVQPDITRSSDGAALADLLLEGRGIETSDADGVTATFDYAGPSIVIALDEADIEALTEAGLPQAFVYLSGRLSSTIILESAPVPGGEPPAVVDVTIEENTTEYVFDLCHLLDQAAAAQASGSP